MMNIDIQEFFKLRTRMPVVDVRSPGEYWAGHIPGAYSIALFNNEERARVGTIYKQTGRKAAIKEGLKIVGPKMYDLAEKAEIIAEGNKQLIVHCWRGGMRSENMAWLFTRIGIKCYVLSGGYKSYRRYCRNRLEAPAHLIILGGYTGSGKTEKLRAISQQGEQFLDLESLANHKGSAFGSLGEKKQLPNEHFENMLFEQWMSFDLNKPIWVEDESKRIGKNNLPEELFRKMRSAQVIKIEIDRYTRVKRLVKDYAGFDKHLLKESIKRISKKLGGENTSRALEALGNDDFYTAADITLLYYDKAYHHGLNKRKYSSVNTLKLTGNNPEKNALILIQKAYELAEQGENKEL